MNYYMARQRKDSKRWDFTCKNDQRIFPVGYCAGGQIWCQANKGPHADKYHDDGHATAEEAAECYKQYQLDHLLTFHDGGESKVLRVCDHPDCEEFTAGTANIRHSMFHLCDKHRTREVVEQLFQVPERMASSY